MNNQSTIFVLFEDEDITMIFSELLQALGTSPTVVHSPEALEEGSAVVTEPRFYEALSSMQKERSLVIGNKTALEKIVTPTLSRPLTEEKIEQALGTLLQLANQA